MDRRDFLKMAGALGLSVAAPGRAFAEGEGEESDIFFIQVQAVGGWEPTMLCDPKGSTNKSYGDGDILTAGNIPYAPMGPLWDTFFTTNAKRMVVVNGVDVQSNNHEAGRRNMASGRLGDGHPLLAALVAGHQAPHLPIAFLSFGGYEETGGVVAPTRQVDKTRLQGIIYPDRVNPADEKSSRYHSEKTRGIIDFARRKRAERQIASTLLPKPQQSMNTLLTARLGSDQLKRLEELLPSLNGTGEEGLVELAIASYRAGVGTAANFARGGFDTHGNHDASHSDAMGKLLALVNMIWQKVDAAGIADRTVMLMTSDFGRTPSYNGNNGKDHWPISSMIVVSGLADFVGDRVVGVTDEGHSPIALDPDTLEPAADPAKGVRIRPENVHKCLRDLMGISGGPVDKMFPLSPTSDLVLF